MLPKDHKLRGRRHLRSIPSLLRCASYSCITGFSFKGEVRDPFRSVISALESTKTPVLAVDAPSSWNIENGPTGSGPGANYNPEALISLTAAKPLVTHFEGRHFIGGR
jgi:NAD(P)H-hydrate epimerase